MASKALHVSPEKESTLCSNSMAVVVIAIAAFLLQILTATRYGYFRDELYYLDCARHLAWGYVDQPPLIAFLAWVERHVSGDSLRSVRFLPAVAGALTALVTGRLARMLGAGVFGQTIAALAVRVAPGFLLFFHLLTMNAFEPLFWTTAAYVVVRIVQTGNQKLWLLFGALSGIGILNKWSMLFFCAGILAGLALTRERLRLLDWGLWFGLLITLLIWLPNVVWNVRHHWPFFELMRNVRASGRDVSLGFLPFLLDQTIFMNIVTAPLWVAGIWWYFFGRGPASTDSRGRYRVFGWAYLFLLAFFVLSKGKSYYLWPAYPLLFAAGGRAFESWTSLRASALRPIYVSALLLGGALFAPFALPVLSPEGFIRYQQALHVTSPAVEHQESGPLQQQVYADMFGWEEMTGEVARAYFNLPIDVRGKTAIAARSFGEAGAVDFFGSRYGLPKVISGHQSYWLWGPGNYTGESVLFVGDSASRVRELCDNVDLVGHVYHPYSRGDEHFDIFWCHPLRGNLQQIWPAAKHFN